MSVAAAATALAPAHQNDQPSLPGAGPTTPNMLGHATIEIVETGDEEETQHICQPIVHQDSELRLRAESLVEELPPAYTVE
jgi:hypothetical protein